MSDREFMYCPLRTGSYCNREKCAWWDKGRCGILSISQSLSGIESHLFRIHQDVNDGLIDIAREIESKGSTSRCSTSKPPLTSA